MIAPARDNSAETEATRTLAKQRLINLYTAGEINADELEKLLADLKLADA